MVGEREKAIELVSTHENKISEDKLLLLLASYIKGGEIIWEGDFCLPDVYGSLGGLERSENNEKIMIDYLKVWYNNHKSASWYDSDKSKNDTYVGYWSFESAAIVKILNVDETDIRISDFYPVF